MLASHADRMMRRHDPAGSESTLADEAAAATAAATAVAGRRREGAEQFESLLLPRRTGADDVSPSTRLRQRQLHDLFGPAQPPVPPDADAEHGSSILTRPRSRVPALHTMPPPTWEELWSILADEPYPAADINSFSEFRSALSSTSQFSSFSPLTASTMSELLEELCERDLTFPIRLSNVRSAPRADPSPLSAPLGSSSLSFSALGPTAPAEPAAEGIWRASFVEHLDEGTTREIPIGSGPIPAPPALTPRAGSELAMPHTFEAFAERRRAERRAHGGIPPLAAADVQSAVAGATEAMRIDSPAAASATSGEPGLDTNAATTPATSAAQSPPAAASSSRSQLGAELSDLCPRSAPPPPTSASLAEAHFRSQRAIAPLPLHRAGGVASSADGPAAPGEEAPSASAILPPTTIAERIRLTVPDDLLVAIREQVETGRLEYDPAVGWSGAAVGGFSPEQLDLVGGALVQLRRLRIRGPGQDGVEVDI